MQIFPALISDGKGLKEDRTGGRKGKRDRTRRGLRKGNGGVTGRNNEHKEVIVTKRNQFCYQKQYMSSPSYNSHFIEKERREVTVKKSFEKREAVIKRL